MKEHNKDSQNTGKESVATEFQMYLPMQTERRRLKNERRDRPTSKPMELITVVMVAMMIMKKKKECDNGMKIEKRPLFPRHKKQLFLLMSLTITSLSFPTFLSQFVQFNKGITKRHSPEIVLQKVLMTNTIFGVTSFPDFFH